MLFRGNLVLLMVSVVLLAASIAIAVTEMRGDEQFPWGIHLVTIPGVFILGLIAGWVMQERSAAEDRARKEISEGDAP